MKKMITLTIISFFVAGMMVSALPSPVAAEDAVDPVRNIFIDTLYGMAIGSVFAAAISLAKGEDEGREWAKNLGAGAAIGGLGGAGYGLSLEYKGAAEIKNHTVCFHVPSLNVFSKDDAVIVKTDLLHYLF